MRQYSRATAASGLKQVFKGLANTWRSATNERKKAAMRAPYQHSVCNEEGAVFAIALVHALSGTCSFPCVPTVDAAELLKVICVAVTSELERMYDAHNAEMQGKSTEKVLHLFQNPVFCVPPVSLSTFPVAYGCARPPAPLRPEVDLLNLAQTVLLSVTCLVLALHRL